MLFNIFKLSVILIAASEAAIFTETLLLEGDEVHFQIDDKLYYFSKDKRSWFDALLACQSKDGYLVSFDNPSDQDAVSHLLKKYYLSYFWWTSGTKTRSTENFYWYYSRQPVKFDDWSPGPPYDYKYNERCLHLGHVHERNRYEMMSCECHHKFYYICEIEDRLKVLPLQK